MLAVCCGPRAQERDEMCGTMMERGLVSAVPLGVRGVYRDAFLVSVVLSVLISVLSPG